MLPRRRQRLGGCPASSHDTCGAPCSGTTRSRCLVVLQHPRFVVAALILSPWPCKGVRPDTPTAPRRRRTSTRPPSHIAPYSSRSTPWSTTSRARRYRPPARSGTPRGLSRTCRVHNECSRRQSVCLALLLLIRDLCLKLGIVVLSLAILVTAACRHSTPPSAMPASVGPPQASLHCGALAVSTMATTGRSAAVSSCCPSRRTSDSSFGTDLSTSTPPPSV